MANYKIIHLRTFNLLNIIFWVDVQICKISNLEIAVRSYFYMILRLSTVAEIWELYF